MTTTNNKNDHRKSNSQEAEILISYGDDHLIKEINKLVLILGSAANEFGILIRVLGSPNKIIQAKALADHR